MNEYFVMKWGYFFELLICIINFKDLKHRGSKTNGNKYVPFLITLLFQSLFSA